MPEIVEQEQELKQQALTVVQRAILVKIVDQGTYNDATKLLLEEIVPFRKKWKLYWDPVRESAYSAYKAILNKIAEIDGPLEIAERQVKAEVRRWDDEQIRIEQERQRQAQEEAEKAAEEERLRAAIVAEQSGASDAEVSAIVDAPVAVVAEPVQPAYQRVSGISRRENWKAQVKDFGALVRAAARDKSLLVYLEPNQRALDARAKADRQTLSIPGIVPYDSGIISARSK
jgi:hypothetical protein